MFDRRSILHAPALDGGAGGLLQQQVVLTFGTQAPKASTITWVVRSVTLTEKISAPYHLQVTLSTREARGRAALLRGHEAWLTIERGRKRRIIRGVVTDVSEGSPGGASRTVEVTIQPAIALLQNARHSRIFADQTIPDIVKQVLEPAPMRVARKVTPDFSEDPIEKREYVVQHQETDYDFAARLLAEEGIWYYFVEPKETDQPEELVLTNVNGKAPPISRDTNVRLALDEVPDAHEEAIYVFEPQESTAATAWNVRQVNWTQPDSLEHHVVEHEEPEDKATSITGLPVHDYGDLHAIDHTKAQYTQHDSERQAQLRFEAERSLQRCILGRSNAVMLRPGHKMTVDGVEYLLTEVTHSASAEATSEISSHTVAFENSFTCVAMDNVFRPVRLPKPAIAGHLFATVVDATGGIKAPLTQRDGNDIAVDDEQRHMRVRVKFNWDETEPQSKGATTSCWVRVAQMWSGAGWGTQFIPRVGMEVIVSFEDGDPDRPLILGCVYNGKNRPPYAAKPTQSGIKTASSVDPTRYNELRFEDAKDAEQIFVRAQKDYVEDVLNNHTTTVHAHQTQTVKKTQSETVLGTQTLTVNGKRTKTIGGDQENGEENTIHGERKTKVTKKHTEEFLDEHHVTVDAKVTEHYRAPHERMVTGPQLFTVETARTETIGGAYNLTTGVFNLTQGGSNMTLQDGKVAVSSSGGPLTIDLGGTSKLNMDANGSVVIDASTAITFKVGTNELTLSMSGIELKASNISATAGPSSLLLTQMGAELKSKTTNIGGLEACIVQGAIVNLN